MYETGCAYYPEYWGAERVGTDAKLMRKCGIKYVRMGEFAWSHMEPEEGKYDFAFLSDAMNLFESYGIKTILCTPTSAAPAWLVRKHPEILIEKAPGKKAHFGVRDHTCYRSEVYWEYTEKLLIELMSAVGNHVNVAGFQIDNEIGHTIFGECRCPVCRNAFREFLKQKYGTVSALNNAWKLAFWSMEYSDFAEIEPGAFDETLSASHSLDSIRFQSESKRLFILRQAELLRKLCPGKPLMLNYLSEMCERYEAHKMVEYAGADMYPYTNLMYDTAYHADFYRNLKEDTPFLVLETGIGGHNIPGVPRDDRLRSYLWRFYAYGAEKSFIFCWRNKLSGYEKELVGVLGYTGVPGGRYRMLSEINAEIEKVNAVCGALPLPRTETALVYGHENHWSYSSGMSKLWLEYNHLHKELHHQLWELHRLCDIIPESRSLDRYKLLFLVQQEIIAPEFAERLKEFTASGGILVAFGGTGNKDNSGNFHPFPGPDGLQELFGIRILDHIPLNTVKNDVCEKPDETFADTHVVFSGSFDGIPLYGSAGVWIGELEVADAEILAVFHNTPLAGKAAFTRKKFGRGYAFFLSTPAPDPETMRRILNSVYRAAGIRESENLPRGVEHIRRGGTHFFLNNTPEACSLKSDVRGTVLTGNAAPDGTIALAPFDVCILKTKEEE